MAPISSSPTSAVEFSQSPRTPASDHSKDARIIPTDKEAPGSGSLHRRIFNTLRSKSRSRSRSSPRTQEDSSPTTRLIGRRKSLVNIFKNASRSSGDGDHHGEQQLHTIKTEEPRVRENFADLFTHLPARRKSIGNFLSPSLMLGTITNKVSQKRLPIQKDPSTEDKVQTADRAELLKDGKDKESTEIALPPVEPSFTETKQNGRVPLYVRLAEGSTDDMVLLESRLARILDEGLRSDIVGGKSRDSSSNAQEQLLVEAEKIRDEAAEACTPESMLPIIRKSSHETQEKTRRGTPDSYLQLLIESCKDTWQNNPDLVSDLSLHEGTQQCSTLEQKSRPITPEAGLQVLKEPCNETQQTTSACISESLLLQPVGIAQRGSKAEEVAESYASGQTCLQSLPASYVTTEQVTRPSSPGLHLQMPKEFLYEDDNSSERSEQLVDDTRPANHEGCYMDDSTRMVWRRQPANMTTLTFEDLDYPSEEIKEANSSHEKRGNFDKIARNTLIDPATGLLLNHDYEVRDTTPDLQDHDYLLSRRDFYAGRSVVTDREVDPSSTSSTSSSLIDLDLDPNFSQRQEERSERYQKLGIVPSAEWKSDHEKIIRSIELTVARMTRNYHSSSDGICAYATAEELNQLDTTAGAISADCAIKFGENEKEVWDAIRIGTHLLAQTETIGRRRYMPSHNFRTDSSLSGKKILQKGSEDLVPPVVPSNRRFQIESDEESDKPSGQFIDICEAIDSCYPRSPASDIFLPSVDDMVESLAVPRTDFESFYATWCPKHTEIGSVDLNKFEVDFCPEYDRFWQRSYGTLAPAPTSIFYGEARSPEVPPVITELQELHLNSQKSQMTSFTATKVLFPGTVNLLQHTEAFASKTEAISALCNYKLGELSNFCTHDTRNNIIYAHSIDSAVPNPADLNPGLRIIWLPMNNHPPTGDATQSGHEEIETSSNSEIANSGVRFRAAVVHRSSSSELNATSEKEVSIVNSIMDDDFFLINDMASQFSEELSQSGISLMGDTGHLLSNVDAMFSLDVEEETKPTSTWLDFNISLKTNHSDQANSESDISDEENICSYRCESTNEICSLHKGLQPPVNSEIGSANGSEDRDRGLEVRYDTLRSEIPSTDEEDATELVICHHYSSLKSTGKELSDGVRKSSSGSEESRRSSDSEALDCASTCGSVGIEHLAGYHFTTVKEHLIRKSEDSQKSSYTAPGQAIEVLFDAAEHIGTSTKSQYVNVEKCSPIEIGSNIITAEPDKDTVPDDDICHSLEDLSSEVNPSTIETLAFDQCVKYDNSPETRFDIKSTNVQENQVTLNDLHLRLVGKASRMSPPTRKEKSKVGTLVNMFQAHGLMPEQLRGHLRVASVSPSLSRHRGTRRGGQSSHRIIGPGTVRKISESLSASSHSVSSPVNRVTTPSSLLDRPHSPRSDVDTEDVDTETSYSFGELLGRVDKHDGKMDSGQSMWDDEMYG